MKKTIKIFTFTLLLIILSAFSVKGQNSLIGINAYIRYLSAYKSGDSLQINHQYTNGLTKVFGRLKLNDWKLPPHKGVNNYFLQMSGDSAKWMPASFSLDSSKLWTTSGTYLYPTTIGKYVGIGTTSPSAKLTVGGTTLFSGNSKIIGNDSIFGRAWIQKKLTADTIKVGTQYTLPTTDSIAGKLLMTNGAGKVYWGCSSLDTSALAWRNRNNFFLNTNEFNSPTGFYNTVNIIGEFSSINNNGGLSYASALMNRTNWLYDGVDHIGMISDTDRYIQDTGIYAYNEIVNNETDSTDISVSLGCIDNVDRNKSFINITPSDISLVTRNTVANLATLRLNNTGLLVNAGGHSPALRIDTTGILSLTAKKESIGGLVTYNNSVVMNKNDTVQMPPAAFCYGTVISNDGSVVTGFVRFYSDKNGTIHIVESYGSVRTSDSGIASIAIFTYGISVVIKNRSGGSETMKINIQY